MRRELNRRVGEECCREVLERSVVEKSWRRAFGEGLARNIGREVLWRSVGEKRCREEL